MVSLLQAVPPRTGRISASARQRSGSVGLGGVTGASSCSDTTRTWPSRALLIYNGATLISLGIDTEKAIGLAGGTFNISAWQIHGRSLTADNLHTVQPLTGIEAIPSTRLWELWYQQSFLDGRLDVKLGQQSIDTEFMTTQYGGLFLNSAMGWPALPANDLYAGGPTFPLSSLGARVRAHPTGDLTFLAGVFDDNPPGGPFDDNSQVRGAEQSGTKFNLNTGALFIAELQYAINPPASGDTDRGNPTPGLPGLSWTQWKRNNAKEVSAENRKVPPARCERRFNGLNPVVIYRYLGISIDPDQCCAHVGRLSTVRSSDRANRGKRSWNGMSEAVRRCTLRFILRVCLILIR